MYSPVSIMKKIGSRPSLATSPSPVALAYAQTSASSAPAAPFPSTRLLRSYEKMGRAVVPLPPSPTRGTLPPPLPRPVTGEPVVVLFDAIVLPVRGS